MSDLYPCNKQSYMALDSAFMSDVLSKDGPTHVNGLLLCFHGSVDIQRRLQMLLVRVQLIRGTD